MSIIIVIIISSTEESVRMSELNNVKKYKKVVVRSSRFEVRVRSAYYLWLLISICVFVYILTLNETSNCLFLFHPIT